MSQLLNATLETLLMVLISGLGALLLGGLLGLFLYITAPGRFYANAYWYRAVGLIVNITRSIPFIIFMIALIPFTRWLVGTPIGTAAAIVPLTLAAAPFFARIAESAFSEVSESLIESIIAMGATPMQVIRYCLLPESMPSLVRGLTITLIALVGYSAMAGVVGGGGLGALAYHYGYQRFDTEVMLITTAILLIMVQVFQWLGDCVAGFLSKRS
jgi:ABC-type methionine transport system permease subunit